MVDIKSRIEDVSITGKPKKRTTGITGLNLLLDGGFPQGTLIMVYGDPVSGVDLAALQFWKVEGEEGTYFMNDGDVDIGMIDATDLHPEMYFQQMAGGRIVIDSLSTIIIKYGIDETLKFLRKARDEMKKRGANLMFVVYTGIHPPVEMTRIMRAADIVIQLKSEYHQAMIERSLAVQKMTGAATPERLLPFVILEKGIEASTTSRVV
jgi:KaiC/GvpD/RAD55 family RecA-like ATPase